MSLFYFRALQEYTCWLLTQFPFPGGGEGRVFMNQGNDSQAGPLGAGAQGAGKRRAGSLALPWLILPALPQLERPEGTASSASSVTDGRLRALEQKGLAHVQRVLVPGFLRIKCLPCPHLACPPPLAILGYPAILFPGTHPLPCSSMKWVFSFQNLSPCVHSSLVLPS